MAKDKKKEVVAEEVVEETVSEMQEAGAVAISDTMEQLLDALLS